MLSLFAAPPGIAANHAAPADQSTQINDVDLSALQNRIKDLRDLLTTMERLRANLVKAAEKALNDADAAPSLTERRRYEQLYTETSARLGELEVTHAELVRLLSELETRMKALHRVE